MFLILLLALPVTGVLYFFRLKYNSIYKRYQAVYSSYKLPDTPEFQTPIDLNLTSGSVPAWLNGIMYRIGPGKFNIKQTDGSTFSIKHAFDGLPFMHRFEINGSAQTLKYNSRLLAGSVERNIREKTYKGLVFFGHVPIVSFYRWLQEAYYRITIMVLRIDSNKGDSEPDSHCVGVTASTNFPLPSDWQKEDRVLVSKTDANILQKIHADTLVPEKIFTYTSYDEKLQGQFSAAHHQFDPETKEIFNFTLSFAPKPRMVVFCTSEDGKAKVLADVTHRSDNSPFQAPYIHSFWLTKNYIIVPESPLTYQDKGLNLLLNGSVLSSMTWVENAPTYFHVICRKGGGLLASIPTTGFFTFHVANGFDTIDTNGDEILSLDCAAFSNGNIMQQLHKFGGLHSKKAYKTPTPTPDTINGMSFPPHRQTCFGNMQRFTVNLTQQKVIDTEIICPNMDFPRYNQRYCFTDHQFLYGCELKGFTEKTDETNYLVKVDLYTKKATRYGQEGYYCSEPIFVQSPNATTEDDGVLLSLVNNTECCFLVVVDATNMTELARFTIGQFSAVTFHGSYVDHEFKNINLN
ncbi:putative carotene-dioxygenase [Thamnidium elegans]|nr:putative carotene-dioxygenase [Thamnidium elegans]